MEHNNLPVIVFGIIAAIILIAFLVYRNLKDKKELEEEMDTPSPPKEHHKGLDDEQTV